MIAMSKSCVPTVIALLGARLYVPVSDDDTQSWAESSQCGPLAQIGEHPADGDRVGLGGARARQSDDPDHLPGRGDNRAAAVALIDPRPDQVQHVVVDLRSRLSGVDAAARERHA